MVPTPCPRPCPPTRSTSGICRKAISEINELGDELARAGDELRIPVVGSGHPLADVMLLKFSPQPSEIQEGVAFFGRSGQAVLKSLQRLHVDPLAVYGTNCLKFGTEDPADAAAWLDARAPHRPAEARRRDGRSTVAFVNDLAFPLSDRLDAEARRSDRSDSRRRSRRSSPRTSTRRSTRRPRRPPSGTPSRRSAPGGRSSLRTSARKIGIRERGFWSREDP